MNFEKYKETPFQRIKRVKIIKSVVVSSTVYYLQYTFVYTYNKTLFAFI